MTLAHAHKPHNTTTTWQPNRATATMQALSFENSARPYHLLFAHFGACGIRTSPTDLHRGHDRCQFSHDLVDEHVSVEISDEHSSSLRRTMLYIAARHECNAGRSAPSSNDGEATPATRCQVFVRSLTRTSRISCFSMKAPAAYR